MLAQQTLIFCLRFKVTLDFIFRYGYSCLSLRNGNLILFNAKPLHTLKKNVSMRMPILVSAESFNWFLKTYRADFIFTTDQQNTAIYVNGVPYPVSWLSRKTVIDRRSIIYIEVINTNVENVFFSSFVDYLKDNALLYLETRCNPAETIVLHLSDFKRFFYRNFNCEITEFLAFVDNRFITSVTDIPDRTITGLIILVRGYSYLNTEDHLSHPVSVPAFLRGIIQD